MDHPLNKFAPSEKYCCCIFDGFLESAYINFIHILTKFQGIVGEEVGGGNVAILFHP